MRKVVIVEDDESMATALRDGFELEGFQVAVARDGAQGMRLAQDGTDLLILDVMLPKMSGIDVCRRIRETGNPVPVIMLTARGQEIDKVLGLRSGADDYVTKPFGFMELMARVEAVMRRAGGGHNGVHAFSFGDVHVDFKRAEATKAGLPVELSPRELRLLQYLVEHRGQVLTREQLLTAVWDYSSATMTRTLDTHVATLRKKIEDVPSNPRFIVTVHRIGYKFTA